AGESLHGFKGLAGPGCRRPKGGGQARPAPDVDRIGPKSFGPFPPPATCVNLGSRGDMEAPMAATPPLDQIEAKYLSLKDQISRARQHPSIDELELAEMKRRKLQLKDELEKLRHDEMQAST